MIDYVEKFLNGNIEVSEFVISLKEKVDLQETINSLIPIDARQNKNHQIWEGYSYEACKRELFDLSRHLLSFTDPENIMGWGLNVWATLNHFYQFVYPDFIPKAQYREKYRLYLDLCGDTYDGSEVRPFIAAIINELWEVPQKTMRKRMGKEEIKKYFRLKEGKKPYWVQGADWPMGEHEPMIFCCQKRNGEKVTYYFEDSESGAMRQVIQYY